MLHYILQVVAFQLGFLIIYDVFLRKETFFNWNRAYLLITAILSMIIPFIKIDCIKTIVSEEFVIHLPEVIIGNISETSTIDPEIANLAGISIQSEPTSIWSIILYAGMCLAALILLFKISKLMVLFYKHPKRWTNNLLIIKLLNSTAAFSFFHYVFLGDKITSKERSSILVHEMVHVKQKHTIDLLFFEILRIVFWFNPLVYMYQNRMTTLHEYIADAKAVKQQNKVEYYNNLLAQVFETKQFSFVNPFFKQSLIKKRIIMLSKTKSKQINIFKYALLVPLVCTMLIYTSSYAQDSKGKTEKVAQTEDENLNHEEMLKKYHDLIVDMKENGASFEEINDFAMPNQERYIGSRTDYYKFTAYTKYIMGDIQDRKQEGKDVSEINEDLSKSLKSKMNRTYEEYVAYKQTEEAKETWENNTKDGVLRLLVNDGNNMTDEEEKRMNHKLDMIERDEYFKKLLITSVDGGFKMILENPKSDKTKKETVLTKKIDEVKHQVEIKGNVTPEEDEGFDLLIKLVSGTELDTDLVKNVQSYMSRSNQTPLMKAINAVFEQIQVQGELSDYEEKSLKRLLVLTTKDGINNPVLQEVVETVEVPFGVVDQVPVMLSCQALKTNEERKLCMSKNIASNINKNFNLDLAKQLGLKGKQRINVIFKIDAQGDVIDARARAPHPKLEEEAIRVIYLLPQFKPGLQDGKAVTVPYSLPIIFQINDDIEEIVEVETIEAVQDEPLTEIPYAIVDNAPKYKGCETGNNNDEVKKCTSLAVAKFVNANFNTKLALSLGLEGKQRINVIFKIDKEGNVFNVKARAPHPKLEEEAKRVIKLLPQFIPGKQKGELVVVPYSLPIVFQVASIKKEGKKN